MTEREKKALDAITKAIPTLDEFSKGFLSGYLAAKDETTEKKTDKKTEELDANLSEHAYMIYARDVIGCLIKIER